MTLMQARQDTAELLVHIIPSVVFVILGIGFLNDKTPWWLPCMFFTAAIIVTIMYLGMSLPTLRERKRGMSTS